MRDEYERGYGRGQDRELMNDRGRLARVDQERWRRDNEDRRWRMEEEWRDEENRGWRAERYRREPEHREPEHREHRSLGETIKGVFRGMGPKNWTRSDERIHDDVCERLTESPYVDASEIVIRVKDGEVTLEGTVNNRVQKRMAEEAIDHVRGVKDVMNHIRVRREPERMETAEGNGRRAQLDTGTSRVSR